MSEVFSLDKIKILIVDDNQDNLCFFEELLTSHDTTIDLATNGNSALEYLKKDDYGLIILDICMPGLDGYEVARKIKEGTRNIKTPIIFITAINISEEKILKGYKEGAIDYLLKPVIPQILQSKVKILIQLEKQKKELEREIESRKRAEKEKEQMYAGLIQSSKLASIGTLSACIAHELNNPLTIIDGFAACMKAAANDSEKVILFSDKILNSIDRMKNIIDHLRRVSRESKKEDNKQVDLNNIIKDSIVLVEALIKRNNIKLHLNFEINSPLIWGNAVQLESIFQNLLTNSIGAFEVNQHISDPQIWLTTKINDSNIAFRYKDNAGGMPKHIAEQIFNPFFTTKEAGKGTGLGMYIAKQIANDHGCSLDVESTENVGTEFSIDFPIDRRKASRSNQDSHQTKAIEPLATEK